MSRTTGIPAPLRRRHWMPGLVTVVLMVAVLLGFARGSAAVAAPHRGPTLSHLAQFLGSGLRSGSTIGPDGALYVSDGANGNVNRIDRHTGAVSVYATGLPPKLLPNGGAMDVAFVGGQAYALVALVGGDIVGGGHLGDGIVGIYRLDGGGHPTVVADLGALLGCAPADPLGDLLTTGVPYAFVPYRGGFLVTDGHHNRVLQVTLGGAITEVATFSNVVPTGLEVEGGRVWVAQAGPVPHVAETGTILRAGPALRAATGRAGRPPARRRGARTPAPAVCPVAGRVGRRHGGVARSSSHRSTHSRDLGRRTGAGHRLRGARAGPG